MTWYDNEVEEEFLPTQFSPNEWKVVQRTLDEGEE